MKHLLLAAVLVVAALGQMACSRDFGPSRSFDHVVLVTIDTLRADHLGSYGYPRPVSPFLDSLAARGVRFDRAISSSSHTGPAHASMFTSQYPARHRVLRNGVKLRPAVPTLAAMLGDSGFDTAAFVAIKFLATVTQGFDTAPSWRRKGYRQADIMVDTALEWFGSRTDEQRFFLWVHLFDVHNSRPDATMPEPHFSRMRAASRERGSDWGDLLQAQLGIPMGALEYYGDRFDRYDSQIAFVDEQVQRLFESLEAQVGDDRILWVVTSDHGEGLGNHDYWGHSKYLYGEQIHVPLIFYGDADWQDGRVVDRMVRHIDLLPTVMELLGLLVDGEALELEGVSLSALLAGSQANPGIDFAVAQRRPTDKERWAKGWESGLVLAVQNERYKYILHSHGQDELYDLESDRLETSNLVGSGLEVERKLAGWLTQKYEWMRSHPLVGTPVNPQIDEQFIEELKALGYLN